MNAISTKFQLPSFVRRTPPYTTVWGEIHSEKQLPPRLFVGDLKAGSFRQNASGWVAEYEDLPFFARIEKKGDSMWFSEGFNGVERSMCVFPAKLSGMECVKGYLRSNGIYDEALKDSFSDLNLTYLPYQSEKSAGITCSFPDATFSTVILPLPFSKESFESIEGLAHELHEAGIPSRGFVKASLNVVNYLDGHCPEIPTNEIKHIEWLLKQGFMPTETPIWEGQKGNRAFTSRRISPILHLCIAQAYLPRLIQALVKWDLIVSKSSTKKDRMAFVMHTLDSTVAESISNFTDDRSRRIFMPLGDARSSLEEMEGTAFNESISFEELKKNAAIVLSDFQKTRDEILEKISNLFE